MPFLTHLDLADTGVSDKGVMHLLDLKYLKYIDLSGTYVSEKGLASLKGKFADLKCDYDYPPKDPDV